MSIIKVENLTKTYGQLKAVDDISFNIKKGEIFGVLGPNGAGKTTTLECIVGLKDVTAGKIKVLSFDPKKDRHTLFKEIGVQLQETSYQDKIKVYELCELFENFYDEPYSYVELLKRFDLLDKRKSYINKLSGGQKQKLSIILALISNPKIIFLDELTTGLDPAARRDMWRYLKDLKDEGRTIIMTTHYMEEAEYLCDRLAIMYEGKIKAIGTVAEVIASSNIDIEITFTTTDEVEQALEHKLSNACIEQHNGFVKITTQKEETIKALIRVLVELGIDYNKLNIKRPNLENSFIKMTGKRMGE
ncbi:ABC transporter ATP-binding protein [Clostridium sp. 'deep sea']|uniref:ABC transporter ATP-binding protein n=1 Tax=Clostridium sp. 'deep sea' TaxID=2779445 RepID=UPI0018969476|nr:ABC transporter ATP-binding protein [Clostridium sp. 'deep sea']QOR36382.1 ABC transporter ATP-binding protein [Clostridium sp. 'deep sea']